jgi:hypothetical protein
MLTQHQVKDATSNRRTSELTAERAGTSQRAVMRNELLQMNYAEGAAALSPATNTVSPNNVQQTASPDVEPQMAQMMFGGESRGILVPGAWGSAHAKGVCSKAGIPKTVSEANGDTRFGRDGLAELKLSGQKVASFRTDKAHPEAYSFRQIAPGVTAQNPLYKKTTNAFYHDSCDTIGPVYGRTSDGLAKYHPKYALRHFREDSLSYFETMARDYLQETVINSYHDWLPNSVTRFIDEHVMYPLVRRAAKAVASGVGFFEDHIDAQTRNFQITENDAMRVLVWALKQNPLVPNALIEKLPLFTVGRGPVYLTIPVDLTVVAP